jgi:hypothetical protein
MHPIFTNRLRLTLYGIAWLCVGCVLAILIHATTPRSWWTAFLLAVPMALVHASICLSAWWVCKSVPLGRTSTLRGVSVVFGAAIVAGVCWAVLSTGWAAVVEDTAARVPGAWSARELPPPGGPWTPEAVRTRTALLTFAIGAPLYLVSAAVNYLVLTFESARTAERRALESQVLARDAEVRALRAQLNPHFLFNSLNSINALVGADPEGARRMCERLGEFLRLTLALAARETVSLADEIQLVEHYLSMEKVRFGERLQSRVRIAPEVSQAPVPPLLLQPLVENAVKHGISERLEGGTIAIEADATGDGLRIVVSNPYDEDAGGARRPGEGVGLANVERRLQTSAAKRTHMTAGKANGVYRVELTLSFDRAPGEA